MAKPIVANDEYPLSTNLGMQSQQAIENGDFLMMVDVPSQRVEGVEQLVKEKHPRAHYEGLEPNMQAFP